MQKIDVVCRRMTNVVYRRSRCIVVHSCRFFLRRRVSIAPSKQRHVHSLLDCTLINGLWVALHALSQLLVDLLQLAVGADEVGKAVDVRDGIFSRSNVILHNDSR